MQNNSTNYDYEVGGINYSTYRQSDPRIASLIHKALGPARRVLNVGAGPGSYEPTDRIVLAVEPAKTMRSQRSAQLSPAIIASAENLPFDDKCFDASMAVLTVHHWADPQRGLSEMRRVTIGPVVILTFDIDAPTEFWIGDYVPEIQQIDRTRFPSIAMIKESLSGNCEVNPVPVYADCKDKIQSALYCRPEELLSEGVRKSQSIWAVLPEGVEERFVKDLSSDLRSGKWDEKYGFFRTKPYLDGQLRLIVGR